eukprot:3223496-Pyramimonas_sp.AAC.1
MLQYACRGRSGHTRRGLLSASAVPQAAGARGRWGQGVADLRGRSRRTRRPCLVCLLYTSDAADDTLV